MNECIDKIRNFDNINNFDIIITNMDELCNLALISNINKSDMIKYIILDTIVDLLSYENDEINFSIYKLLLILINNNHNMHITNIIYLTMIPFKKNNMIESLLYQIKKIYYKLSIINDCPFLNENLCNINCKCLNGNKILFSNYSDNSLITSGQQENSNQEENSQQENSNQEEDSNQQNPYNQSYKTSEKDNLSIITDSFKFYVD
jgi:hypothetical protein